MDLIEFNDGTFSFGKDLSKNEFLEKIKGHSQLTIYKEKYGIEVYNTREGILVADSNYYSRYESAEDFEKVLFERDNPVKGREIMFKKK